MASLKTLLSIVPYPLFPPTSAGRKQIINFYNRLSVTLDMQVANIRYPEGRPQVDFKLLEIFNPSVSRIINPLNYFRLRKAIRHANADFVLFEHPYMAWMGLLLRRKNDPKWGIRSHNIEYERFRQFGKWWWPIMKAGELYVYSKADAVFFITDDDLVEAQRKTSLRNAYVMPTGMALGALPRDGAECRAYLRERHGIRPDEKILLYNGALGYLPNRQALDVLLHDVNPRLEQMTGFSYKLIICGSGLPESYEELRAYADHNIIYCGFVDDISVYFKGADLYLNPLIGGGGIKTRLVEAISFNTNAVSTRNGYIGFHGDTVEEKVMVVDDGDWAAFAEAIQAMCAKEHPDTTESFYDYYFWDNIVMRFVSQVNSLIE